MGLVIAMYYTIIVALLALVHDIMLHMVISFELHLIEDCRSDYLTSQVLVN